MTLLELLACPACRSPVASHGEAALACQSCARQFPIVDGIPVMLLDPKAAFVTHEHDLPVRPGYSRWKERLVIKSLTDAQVVLDFGAGNQSLDDPCIVRMDLVLGPHIDVVGDVHALPFRDDCIDFAFGGAVMEHLRAPHLAADEIYRVLKPGGYVYADWNFLIAYHGYPHHYFNATLNGVGETFKRFTQIELAVGPFHESAFALRSILGTYLRHFEPRTLLEREFAQQMERLLWFPLNDFDTRIPAADRFRVAVSGYVFGAKQPADGETVVPDAVVRAWAGSADLQARYPQPFNLSVPDNVMAWAKREGRQADPDIERCLAEGPRFSKRGPAASWDRSTVDAWPWELMDRPDRQPDEEEQRWALWFSRPWMRRMKESWQTEAPSASCAASGGR